MAELNALGTGNGSTLAAAHEFCARVHEVPFRITTAEAPPIGSPVTLGMGDPLRVLNGAGVVGLVDGPIADRMRACLRLDWAMTGTVDQLDESSGEGVVVVSGGS